MDINTSKLKLSYILIFCLFVLCEANAQFVITKQMNDRMDGKLPKEQLDKGVYRCIYHFTQQVIECETGETHFVGDTMALDLGRVFSVYYDWNKMRQDSVRRTKMEEISKTVKHIDIKLQKDMADYNDKPGSLDISSVKGESAKIYKNRTAQEMIIIDGTDMEVYKCIEKIPFQLWNFTTDTLTVLGYNCQKASTSFRGRVYEAWFTPEIPLKDGPWKLYGLPGLILKATTDDGLFVFEAIGLENLDKNDFITLDKDTYINCTYEQLANWKGEHREKLGVRHVINGNATVGSTQNPYEYNDLETGKR